MLHYYNFTVSENQISFDPYWHNKSNFLIDFILGIIVLIPGISVFHINNFKIGLILSLILSAMMFLNGIYKWRIKDKTTFLFDKTDNAFYNIDPLGKRKIIELSNLLEIITKSGSRNFNYILIGKKNNVVKRIYLTNNIKNESQTNPEVRFLEMEIIPQLESFLNLKKEALITFDSEASSI